MRFFNNGRLEGSACGAALAPATIALLLASGCVVTRLSRPAYEGTVVDSTTQAPLPEVNVIWGDLHLLTDAQGKFMVPAVTRHELTFAGWEAPPLAFSFSLHKAGYCERENQYFDSRGGGGGSSVAYVWKARLPLVPLSDAPCPPAGASVPTRSSGGQR